MSPGAPALERLLTCRWLLRSRRRVAALMLAVLALGCGEASLSGVDVSEATWISSAGDSADVSLTRSPAGEGDVGIGAPGVPAERQTPHLPTETLQGPCVCGSAIPLSAGVALALSVGVPTPREVRAGDSLLPPSPTLEPPLRPPVALAR